MTRRAGNRKKLVVSESALKARACKGLADANVTFCGRGDATECVRGDIFIKSHRGVNAVRGDVPCATNKMHHAPSRYNNKSALK